MVGTGTERGPRFTSVHPLSQSVVGIWSAAYLAPRTFPFDCFKEKYVPLLIAAPIQIPGRTTQKHAFFVCMVCGKRLTRKAFVKWNAF